MSTYPEYGTIPSVCHLWSKRALVEVAEGLFTEHGYANTSLDAIVAGARVTKGALYHHFSGKQALFEAVFERVETDAITLRLTKDEASALLPIAVRSWPRPLEHRRPRR